MHTFNFRTEVEQIFRFRRLGSAQPASEKRWPAAHILSSLVTPVRLELSITGLRSRRPCRLDEGAMWQPRRDLNPRSPDRQSGALTICTTGLYFGTGLWIRTTMNGFGDRYTAIV